MYFKHSPRPISGWKVAAGAAGGLGAILLVRKLFPAPEYRLHAPDDAGVVWASPAGLARASGASLPAYALASAMQSEEHSPRGRLAVGQAILNAVRGRQDKIFPKLAPHGQFGSQEVNPYAATSRGPTAETLELAKALLDGRVADLVRGATQWDAPAAQDRRYELYLRDPVRYPKYRHSSADVAARRKAEGKREVRVTGVPNTRFWTAA